MCRSGFLNSPPARRRGAGHDEGPAASSSTTKGRAIAAPPAVDARDRARYGRIRPHPDRSPVDRAPDRPPGSTLDEHRLLLGIGPRAELGRKGVFVSRERAAAAPRAIDLEGIAPRRPADLHRMGSPSAGHSARDTSLPGTWCLQTLSYTARRCSMVQGSAARVIAHSGPTCDRQTGEKTLPSESSNKVPSEIRACKSRPR